MHPVSMATAKAGQHQGIKIKNMAAIGFGGEMHSPSPGPEVWVSPGTCQERLRRRCATMPRR